MRRTVLVLAVLAVAAGGAPRPLAGQSATLGEQLAGLLTPWGDPDLQGLWNYSTNTPLQRPEEHAGREWLTEEEVEAANLESRTFATSERRSELTPLLDLSLNFNQFWWDIGGSTGRTSLITDPADGRLPPRTPSREAYEASAEAQRLQEARWGLGPAHGPEDMEPNDRCIADRQVPVRAAGENDHVQILQAPGYVVILRERIHDFRIIPVADRPGLPDGVRQWLGVSRGRWEGATLVVETTNFHPEAQYLGSGPHGHVVERFTRRGENSLEYTFTVTDPSVWTRPWTATLPWRATDGPLFEYACHEGNYSMTNLLVSARAVEARR
ncbi:MAG: hypothetical protein F4Z04_10995 [Acidobacteria bacterium]|nr:hypothetical protein [Acidobacteriota bacterium]